MFLSEIHYKTTVTHTVKYILCNTEMECMYFAFDLIDEYNRIIFTDWVNDDKLDVSYIATFPIFDKYYMVNDEKKNIILKPEFKNIHLRLNKEELHNFLNGGFMFWDSSRNGYSVHYKIFELPISKYKNK